MKETIERTWSKKDFCMTIGLANRGVKGLLTLKNGLGDYTQERQEWLIDHAIDDVVHAIWRLSKREKPYKQFKQEYLEMETAAFGLEG
jgi:hypothetical protein